MGVSEKKWCPHNHRSLIRLDLYWQSLVPAVLFARKLPSCQPVIPVSILIQRSGGSIELAIANSDVNARILANILDPLRIVKVFGQDIKVAVRFNEPDFYLARFTTDPPDSGEIKVRITRGLILVCHGS